jgi:hypothetical protein
MNKTYLCVKQHKTTGLKYFCKTKRNNPESYLGSGVNWVKHLKEYGPDIINLQIWEFDDEDKCSDFAIKYSIDNNIVESKDWANLKIENGLDGGSEKGHKKPPRSPEHTENHRLAILGRPNPKTAAALTGKKLPEDVKKKISNSLKGIVRPPMSQETKNKVSFAKRGIKLKIVTCPHCGKSGGGGAIYQWHFDNCRNIK